MLKGAAIFAAALLASGAAAAEEKRLGDFIYVPAMQVTPVSGSISLRVEGLALGNESDEPEVVSSLAGAQFGVYVFSGSGDLTPWANPLYPSEQMRIRSGEGETRFSLPQGAEFYLRQESAPQGYFFDDETLIPVTGEEIVVRNSMAGQIAVSAVDSLGVPVAGVQILLEGEDGSQHALVTDENGQAVLTDSAAQGYVVSEGNLPEGVFAARGVSGGMMTENGVYAQIEPASRTRVTFEHPASGSVLLDMRLNILQDDGQISEQPLEGVRLDIYCDPMISVVTDEQGQARTSLLEGTYAVHLSYEGNQQVQLPISDGQMIVSSGSTTVIELNAVQTMGRIVLRANAEKAFDGGSFSLVSEENGMRFGPYAMDAQGMAVSQLLDPGVYRVADLDIAGGVQFGAITCMGETAAAAEDLTLTVYAGQLTEADIQLITREKQTFGVACEEIDETGAVIHSEMDAQVQLTLVDAQGQAIEQLNMQDGVVTVEALSGQYALRMSDQDAQKLGVQPLSAVFMLPSEQETVNFPAERTRVLISAVNERGEIAAHAAYQLTDSVGDRYEVVCDEDGMAVSPLLAVGDVYIETLDAPSGHAPAQLMMMQAVAGKAAAAEIVHESLGVAALSVSVKSLDENGDARYAPVQGASIRLYRVSDDGSKADMGMTVLTDESGEANIALEAGDYAADVEENSLSLGMSAAQMAYLSVANTMTS